MNGPDPSLVHPVPAHRRIVFLKPLIANPLIEVGDYTYYDDPDGAEHFEQRCVQHQYPFIGDRLVIGRFTAIGRGATFIMNGANHAMAGFSTYPFNIFGGGWEKDFDFSALRTGLRGDTVVGNDVWLGQSATVLPGVTIGDGAVVGLNSVVSRSVEPYTIVAGNPARPVRRRFEPEVVERLLQVAWWNWSVEKISRNLGAIRGADIEALERAA